ncbi:adenosylhomocysteinase [Aegilops tauschii subsp. strangulata]|uniref:adenosylhomocysteinase n=1 Tax=Aegilops tauschii subsp. strangulata TaxID=200361 RepID=UPI001ABC5F46|nr:adenosylhomocysteinase [Aegilops tauschii subsp. strangulata]
MALKECWWCTERCLDWGVGGGPDLIIDDATLLIHHGVKADEESGKVADPESTDNPVMLAIVRTSTARWRRGSSASPRRPPPASSRCRSPTLSCSMPSTSPRARLL